MSIDYIYVPGRGTVLQNSNGQNVNDVVGNEFADPKTVQAQVKAPKEVVFDVRPKVEEPLVEIPPVIVEMAPKPEDVEPVQEVKVEELPVEVIQPIEIEETAVGTVQPVVFNEPEQKEEELSPQVKRTGKKRAEIKETEPKD
jgi:hypothetical protein